MSAQFRTMKVVFLNDIVPIVLYDHIFQKTPSFSYFPLTANMYVLGSVRFFTSNLCSCIELKVMATCRSNLPAPRRTRYFVRTRLLTLWFCSPPRAPEGIPCTWKMTLARRCKSLLFKSATGMAREIHRNLMKELKHDISNVFEVRNFTYLVILFWTTRYVSFSDIYIGTFWYSRNFSSCDS